MDKIYDQSYYTNYDIGKNSPVSYKEYQPLQDFFKHTAAQIMQDFHPKTTLDAGCAMGLLVKELHDCGVEAYGIDISEYAIANVDPSISANCAVGSLADPFPEAFPKHFDLITNIEVIEHLSPEDGAKAIANLCSHTDRVLFSSTSTDFEDPTHINVQQSDYWSAEFAKHGFYNRIDNYPTYLSADAYLFEHCDVISAIKRYEQTININHEQLKDTMYEVKKWKYCSDKQAEHLSDLRNDFQSLQEQQQRLNEQLAAVSGLYQEILHSQYWRITKPFRMLTGGIKKALHRYKITRYPCKALKVLLQGGPREVYRRTHAKFHITTTKNYSVISAQRRKAEQDTVFPKKIKFSILVPLYNTPLNFLHEMIESVQNQTYSDWELCLADGSDAQHDEVGKCVAEYCANDKRIVYKKLEKNLGISENTNACIRMATGDYIGLFDHDDVLHSSALFENMKAICEHNADFLYTDEATFEGDNISKLTVVHFKPDYAIDNLRANNYICHFSVFSRKLLNKAGMFDHNYDGSQDHDMILRLTENAEKVWHIRKLLYFWRSHANSVSMDISSKTYAIEAGKRAVRDSIERAGYKAVVESSKACPTIYRIKYELKINPLVSIIIPNMNHLEDLERCISSILFKSTYKNYEIIIVENNSDDKKLFEYYESFNTCNNISVINYEGKFNYSDINNIAVKYAKGDYLILLNNDTEVITPEWMEEMLMYAQRDDVGAVGAKLYYPNDTIQHGGVIIGLGGIAGHSHLHSSRGDSGYMGRMFYANNVSAVTGACLMVKKDLYEKLNGFDCEYAVAFNDVDFCMRIREQNLLIVFTPYAELYHYESVSRGFDNTPEKRTRFLGEISRFENKWGNTILKNGDPYYNPNFSLLKGFEILYDRIGHEDDDQYKTDHKQ